MTNVLAMKFERPFLLWLLHILSALALFLFSLQVAIVVPVLVEFIVFFPLLFVSELRLELEVLRVLFSSYLPSLSHCRLCLSAYSSFAISYICSHVKFGCFLKYSFK